MRIYLECRFGVFFLFLFAFVSRFFSLFISLYLVFPSVYSFSIPVPYSFVVLSFFFFHDMAPTEISTLPYTTLSLSTRPGDSTPSVSRLPSSAFAASRKISMGGGRSEEHTPQLHSHLISPLHLTNNTQIHNTLKISNTTRLKTQNYTLNKNKKPRALTRTKNSRKHAIYT